MIEQLAAWLSQLERLPVVYAAYHQSVSQNRPSPWLGLCYQDGEVCPWWRIGEVLYDFPAHHLGVLSAHRGSQSAPVMGEGGLWVCTFDLSDGPRELFDDWRWEPRPLRQPALVVHAFRQVAQAFLKRGETSHLHLKAAVLQLLATALDDWSGEAPQQILSPVFDLIHEQYGDPDLLLPDLAAAASLSVDHFGRVFREATGTTPMRYLREIRLRQARALLASSDLRIGDVAREVGFRDPLHFSRTFREEAGRSPRQWRRRDG